MTCTRCLNKTANLYRVRSDIVDMLVCLRCVLAALEQTRELIETLEKLVDRNITFSEGMVISGLTYKDIQQAREVLAKARQVERIEDELPIQQAQKKAPSL